MTVRLVIVGCGAIAEAMHLPAAAALPEDVRIEALVDPDPARREALQSKYEVPCAVADLDEVISAVDAAILCAPPHLHRDLAVRAFARGLHVLCEKPMANSRAECDEMIAAAQAADRVLALAHIYRFYPARRAVKELIDRRSLGDIRRVWIEQGGVYSWKTVTGYSMRRELTPGGVLIDSGIHPLDTLLWWCGAPAEWKYEDDACGGLESNARLHMRSSSGYPVELRISRTCWLDSEFHVEGEEGEVVLSAFSTSQYEIRRDGRVEKIAVDAAPVSPAVCSRRQLLDFVAAIRGEQPPWVPGVAGAEGIGLIEQCYASKRAGPLPAKAPLPGLTW